MSDHQHARAELARVLGLPEGPGRREALERAVDARLAAGPPDEAVSNALAQLGRFDAMREALLAEVHGYATETSSSPMLLGAWGAHLVKAFARLGDQRYKAFRRFLVEAYAREGEGAGIVEKALVVASLTGDEAALRRDYLGTTSDVHMDWRASQAGFDPSF